MVKRFFTIFLSLFLFLSLHSVLHAGAFQLYSESSAEALSLSGSVIGREGMLSNAWYNPASTSTIEKPGMMAGVSGLLLRMDYNSDLGSDSLQKRLRPTGFFYGILPLDHGLNLSLSINAPYGMITEWDNDWIESTLATYTNLRCIYFTPNLVWKANDELSFAAGFNLVYGTARIARNIPNAEQLAQLTQEPVPGIPAYNIPTNNKIYLSADAIGIGYTLSTFYQPHEDWNVGIAYQSRVRMRFDGDAKYRHTGVYESNYAAFGVPPRYVRGGSGDTDIVLPSSLGFGIANKSFEKLTLSFDAVWTEWSTYDRLTINLNRMPYATSPRSKGYTSKKKGWDDVWSFRFGVSYDLNENWVLRCGFMHDKSPDNSKYRTPEMPDSDRNMVSLGLGYMKDNWGLDFAYSYLKLRDSKAGRLVADASDNFRNSGKFSGDLHIVSAAVKYMF
ncbi:MAG: transporter [Oligosphaeraceae bacterium]|nr:transporter [Oligosphaeraceae bacterium]